MGVDLGVGCHLANGGEAAGVVVVSVAEDDGMCFVEGDVQCGCVLDDEIGLAGVEEDV